MTYPPKKSMAGTNAWLAEAIDLCKRSGLSVEVVSSGGTPDLYSAHEVTVATEHRPGTYVYSDRSLVELYAFGEWADCALRVQARVVSHAASDRCVIDAGSKSLSSDLLGLQGYGHIVEHPDWEIVGLSEEHGHVSVAGGAGGRKWANWSASFPTTSAWSRICTTGSTPPGRAGSRISTTFRRGGRCSDVRRTGAARRARRAEGGIERGDDGARLIAGDAVADRLAVPARADQALESQARQSLRHRRLPARQQPPPVPRPTSRPARGRKGS